MTPLERSGDLVADARSIEYQSLVFLDDETVPMAVHEVAIVDQRMCVETVQPESGCGLGTRLYDWAERRLFQWRQDAEGFVESAFGSEDDFVFLTELVKQVLIERDLEAIDATHELRSGLETWVEYRSHFRYQDPLTRKPATMPVRLAVDVKTGQPRRLVLWKDNQRIVIQNFVLQQQMEPDSILPNAVAKIEYQAIEHNG